jgi:aryl carrier-like protein
MTGSTIDLLMQRLASSPQTEAAEPAPSALEIPDENASSAATSATHSAESPLSGLGGPPQTDAERAVADAVRAVLELDAGTQIGRGDNFFALGGDSLAALKVVARLNETGSELDIIEVFQQPTLAELALAWAEAAEADAHTPAAEPMSASGLDDAALAALRASLELREAR